MANLRATQSFHACGRMVLAGEEVDADDPIVTGREVLFEQVDAGPSKPAPAKKATAKKAAAKKSADA